MRATFIIQSGLHFSRDLLVKIQRGRMPILNRTVGIYLRKWHLFLNEQQNPFYLFLGLNIERLVGTALVYWQSQGQF